ncbi:MAG: MBL fold metallo-hydrolase [Parcubacteria group bacterium]|nr:MBL fold metallo-hydrolase [Parcubacteria group bacterium]
MTTLTFHGAARGVTGSNYLIESDHGNVLVDCGLFQGCYFCDERNYAAFPYDPHKVHAVLLTHAHMDHAGRLPKLIKDGFRGTVYVTPPTEALAKLMLSDSADLIAREAERIQQPQPLYTAHDVDILAQRFRTVPYDTEVPIADGISFLFHDAGHILGSATVELRVAGRTILFSGDLGNAPTPLLPPPAAISHADYLVVESTYGDRTHEDTSRRKEKLSRVIEETVRRGGTLMMPAFALERTQEILSELNSLVEGKRIPSIPVYLDSPLAIRATTLYGNFTEYFNGDARARIINGDDLFRFPGLRFTVTSEESRAILNDSSPKIIIAGSGMSSGGRILFHERNYLPNEASTLLILGYQAQGSLGRDLLEGARTVRIFDTDVPVRARIVAIGGYSAHADREQLVSWMRSFAGSLRWAFVTHGEAGPGEALAEVIRETFGVSVQIPQFGESVSLS